MVTESLKNYIDSAILPMYDNFDAAHRRDHVQMVIEQSIDIARGLETNEDMVYTIAAYHDTGLVKDRQTHHLVSGEIIREDACLKEWFNDEQIEVMAQAVEDHRASSDHEPRSIYGMIVAEADRFIDPDQIIIRTVQYGLEHYPELDKEGHYKRTLAHMHEKYADGGYLKLWFPYSPNAKRLEELRIIIRNEPELRIRFEKCYENLVRNWRNEKLLCLESHYGKCELKDWKLNRFEDNINRFELLESKAEKYGYIRSDTHYGFKDGKAYLEKSPKHFVLKKKLGDIKKTYDSKTIYYDFVIEYQWQDGAGDGIYFGCVTHSDGVRITDCVDNVREVVKTIKPVLLQGDKLLQESDFQSEVIANEEMYWPFWIKIEKLSDDQVYSYLNNIYNLIKKEIKGLCGPVLEKRTLNGDMLESKMKREIQEIIRSLTKDTELEGSNVNEYTTIVWQEFHKFLEGLHTIGVLEPSDLYFNVYIFNSEEMKEFYRRHKIIIDKQNNKRRGDVTYQDLSALFYNFFWKQFVEIMPDQYDKGINKIKWKPIIDCLSEYVCKKHKKNEERPINLYNAFDKYKEYWELEEQSSKILNKHLSKVYEMASRILDDQQS